MKVFGMPFVLKAIRKPTLSAGLDKDQIAWKISFAGFLNGGVIRSSPPSQGAGLGHSAKGAVAASTLPGGK